MKLRAPLYLKIGAWLVANLLLVALLLAGFVAVQYHLGLDSLLAGRAGDRVEAVAGVIAAELRGSEPEKWDAILAPFTESYRVRFSVYRDDGTRLAGDATALPEAVRVRLAPNENHREHGPGPGRPPRDDGAPPPPAGDHHEERARPDHGEPPLPPPGRPSMIRTSDPARYWVLVRLPVRAPGTSGHGPRFGPAVILVAVSDSLGGGGLFIEWTPWLLAGIGVLALSILCWLPLVRGLTRALWRLTEATGRIAEGRFDVRVPDEKRGDELGALAGSINRMAARLDGFVTGQKRFLGDIAHELCAPLARLQMAAGILEQRAAPEAHANLADLREEIEQMSALVGELLSFSKASLASGAAGNGVHLGPVNLGSVVEQAIRRELPEGESAVNVQIPPDLRVRADADLLLRAVSNLLRNACRHAAGTGPIEVTAATESDGQIRLRVRDHGPGIPQVSLPRVFDPFYRIDPSRDRATGGVGLGLAIVKTCVEACGGSVAGRNVEPTGFEVTFILLAAVPDPS